jgi:hypothetical protein
MGTSVTHAKQSGEPAFAWLDLQDDADCHPFRVAVPFAFARHIAKLLESDAYDRNNPLMVDIKFSVRSDD